MSAPNGPLLTAALHERMRTALREGARSLQCSLDLERSQETILLHEDAWERGGPRFPYLARCKERTIYYWTGDAFEPAARYGGSLIKLVPTEWGPPTFEIDGIKMLPTARVSPYEDAMRKTALVKPRGKLVLDTCGGLGYFAACCVQAQASRVLSFEKNGDVLWLRTLNPWSPEPGGALELAHGDVLEHVPEIPDRSVDAVLHDPPRFGIAGELYSFAFYEQLARVLKRRGRLFHYTGEPNKLTSGRNVAREVAKRLQQAGFSTELSGDGVLALKR